MFNDSIQHNNLTVRFETITPSIAESYWAKNTKNRNFRPRVASQYAFDMTNDDWDDNGETVKFSCTGKMIDGQHRIAAIMQSGITQTLLVVYGAADEAQMTVDAGSKRKFADALKLNGESAPNSLASAVRAVTMWQHGTRKLSGSGGSDLTNHVLERSLRRNSWLRDAMPLMQRVQSHVRLPMPVIAPLYWAFTEIDYDDAIYFFERLISDENHSAGEPIYTLRKTLQNLQETRQNSKDVPYVTALIIKAWNAYRAGETVRLLSYRPGGARPERFPEPK